MKLRLRPRAAAFGVLLGYVVAARGVGNLYPLSTFEMYGKATLNSASRIVVDDEKGVAREVGAFASFDCEAPVDPDPRACLDRWPYGHLPGVDAAVASAINRSRHSGEGQPVAVVRRIWRYRDDGEHVETCVLAHCQAVLR